MNNNYDKESEEYISNGHYSLNGEEFMSVWTYKDKYHYGMNNTAEANSSMTMEMDAKYGLCNAKCIMELGFMKGEYVQLHSLKDLKEFLPKRKFKISRK
jgi:hypothetical protein